MQRRCLIIGGGAAGAALVAQLARNPGAPAIDWVVGAEKPGRGIAYASDDASHLLNVRAAAMSSIGGTAPGDFAQYLRDRGFDNVAADFVPRALYGDYVQHALAQAAHPPTVHAAQATALHALADGRFGITLDDGGTLVADEVVLAIGALPARALPGASPAALASGAYTIDAWHELAPSQAPAHVLVVGTALSAIDVLLTAAQRWPQAQLTAISRHGRWPRLHAPGVLAPFDGTDALLARMASRADVAYWLHCLREAAQEPGADWRAVIDGLRAATPRLWQSLDTRQRRRFLRHLKPLWDIARHRVPQENAAKIEALQRSGRLRVFAARLAGVDVGTTRALRVRLRDARTTHEFETDFAIQATGLDLDARATPHPLVRQLVDDGLVGADALGLGLCASPDGRLLRADGEAWPNLHAIGTLLSGALWETSAMREIGAQAAALAERLGTQGGSSRTAATAPRARRER